MVIGKKGYGFLASVRRTAVSEITAEWVDNPLKARQFSSHKAMNKALVDLREAGYGKCSIHADPSRNFVAIAIR